MNKRQKKMFDAESGCDFDASGVRMSRGFRHLRSDTRDKLLAIADEKVRRAGLDGVHVLVDQACTVFEKLAQFIGRARTREGLIGLLDAMELSEEDERMLLGMAQHFEHLVREAVTVAFEKGIKELPPVPSGRRRVLTPDLANKITEFVWSLYKNDVDLQHCKQRAAQRFGVSFTTVQRAWSQRGTAKRAEVDAAEFVEFIRTNLMTSWLTPESSITEIAKTEYKAIAELSGGPEPRGDNS